METIFYTVLTGTLTYVIGQIIVKLIIDPIHELKKTIGEIAHHIIEYGDIIANPGEPEKESIKKASNHLRNLSSQLSKHLYLIPIYDKTAYVFSLPKKNNVMNASRDLMSLSLNIYGKTDPKVHEHNAKYVEKIHKNLGIYFDEKDKWPD